MVHPTNEFDPAIATTAHQIACAVHPTTVERVFDEPLGCQFLAVPIAARDTRTADPQFALCADTDRGLLVVQYIKLGVGDGQADVDHGLGPACRLGRRPDRCLGRAVHVGDCRIRRLAQIGNQRAGQRLAP